MFYYYFFSIFAKYNLNLIILTMALIDLASWKPKSDEFVFAYRYPQTNLSTYTQLIVYESQEAFLFSKGKLMGKFGPGKHTLDTENLPVLRSLFGIPFGGKNPFTAEIWLINKVLPANLDWRINRMTTHDADYNTQIPLTANGQYGLKIVNAEKFLINMVGTKDVFTQTDMVSQAKGEFTTKVKSAIMQFMITNHVGFKQISAYLDRISDFLRETIKPFWEVYGLELTKFYVSSIDIDDSTPDGKKVKDAIAQQSSMSITGHTWQQEQAYDMANNAMGQMGKGLGNGSSGGLLGGLMALQMMSNMQNGGMGNSMMQAQYNQPTFGGSQGMQMGNGSQMANNSANAKMVFCANCSKKHSTNEKFCPFCGHEYNPCPKCGSDNLKTAKRCISCGTPLSSSMMNSLNCPNCGAPITAGASFCSSCGSSITSSSGSLCPRCGTQLDPSVKFCPTCGYKKG